MPRSEGKHGGDKDQPDKKPSSGETPKSGPVKGNPNRPAGHPDGWFSR